MQHENKSTYLQLRVSQSEKRMIQRQAKNAKMTVSQWVLARIDPILRQEIQKLCISIGLSSQPSYLLAELNDLLSRMQRPEFERVFADIMRLPKSEILQNQIAAMIELTAHRLHAITPQWVCNIPPLTTPVFATKLKNLRLHLLLHSPPPFKKRNIFVDASIGERI
ncbi:MAG: hypothetical protein JW841_11605 [Deltaproteobacteria bacterium]|nr:hypothetical protein [Deltaproteobacteria bacterium]